MKKKLYIFCIAALLASCAVDTTCRQDMDVLLGLEFSGDSIKVSTEVIKIPVDTVKIPIDSIIIGVDSVYADSIIYRDSVVYRDSVIYQDSIAYSYAPVTFTSVKGMSVHGAQRDSLLADATMTVNSLRVPLRKDTDLTSYVLNYRGKEDTLLIAYKRTEMYISLACGCAIFATIDSAWCPTNQFIDSVDILNTAVTTGKDNHVKIYLHNPE